MTAFCCWWIFRRQCWTCASNPDRTVFNAAALIEVAGVFDIPVLCSVQNAEKLGGFLPELTDKISQPKIWNKLEFNCFESEDIARAIAETGRRTLLMAGLEGHVCIFHTAVGALRLGYRVHIAHDAVTSRNASDRQIGMQRLDRAGAVISSTEMITFELLHRAGTKGIPGAAAAAQEISVKLRVAASY